MKKFQVNITLNIPADCKDEARLIANTLMRSLYLYLNQLNIHLFEIEEPIEVRHDD